MKEKLDSIMGIPLYVSSTFFLTLLFGSNVAIAHGFGQRYDLPVPLPLWILGAGATILLSFFLDESSILLAYQVNSFKTSILYIV